jgi:hypothetical protein
MTECEDALEGLAMTGKASAVWFVEVRGGFA